MRKNLIIIALLLASMPIFAQTIESVDVTKATTSEEAAN